METRFKISGFEEISAALRNLGEKSKDHAARTMRRGAARIVASAKNYVPEDTGRLSESIRAEDDVDASNRRLKINIMVGGVVRGVDTDRYAAIIHEHYESMIGGKYGKGPSPTTLSKMQRFPGKVGSHFLHTAVEEQRPSIEAETLTVVNTDWDGEL